jgi:hypothetical protein
MFKQTIGTESYAHHALSGLRLIDASGGIGEKEVEKSSFKAEESAGLAALDPIHKEFVKETPTVNNTTSDTAGEYQ